MLEVIAELKKNVYIFLTVLVKVVGARAELKMKR